MATECSFLIVNVPAKACNNSSLNLNIYICIYEILNEQHES